METLRTSGVSLLRYVIYLANLHRLHRSEPDDVHELWSGSKPAVFTNVGRVSVMAEAIVRPASGTNM